MLGYDEDELENNLGTWASLVHPDEKASVLQQADDYLHGISTSFEVEMRMRHKQGHYLFIRSRAFKVISATDGKPERLIGTHVDITYRKKSELFNQRYTKTLELIAKNHSSAAVCKEIALTYEERHPSMRCAIWELQDDKLVLIAAPSLPKAFAEAINTIHIGQKTGSANASANTDYGVFVTNIANDPTWDKVRQYAKPQGLTNCWSEPIKSSSGRILGALEMHYNLAGSPSEQQLHDLRSAAKLSSILMERDYNQRRIQQLAYADQLTGLASRAHLNMSIEELIKTSKRYQRRFSLLYVDLDNFKNVNDRLGHDIGDQLLQAIGHRLRGVGREIDCASRLGGDEFCIAVKEIDASYNVASVAQRCLNIIASPVEIGGSQFLPSCSIGIARYPEDGKDLKTLLKAADIALYSAKDQGKNRYAFYNQELTLRSEHRLKVEKYLRTAIEDHQISCVFQPQIDMLTGTIIGGEVLSRWYHPLLGAVPPEEFIATAERIGVISRLTEWVLYTACTEAAKWQQNGFPDFKVAVNISSHHIFDGDFIPLIKRVIRETGITANNLELEVTESVLQSNQHKLSVFKKLKDLGIRLAIDEFGMGYTSFAMLRQLNVDLLKIDKFFVDDIGFDKKTRLLVNSMINMGHNLEHKVVAEGIEKSEQLSVLKELGCDTAQGYLLGKPVNADEMSKLLVMDSLSF